MSFEPPPALCQQIDALVARYPQKRSAVLMVLHALQEHYGHLTLEALEWTARRLDMEPIHVDELVTFYPMFRQEPVGRLHLKICRTLSCALAGSHRLHRRLCEKLGLDPDHRGPQTTPDGAVTVEFVECLATCDAAPVALANDRFLEKADWPTLETLITQARDAASGQSQPPSHPIPSSHSRGGSEC
ncbi:MAG: NAD(P)H-dependent oxidoreductase subunit E [Verrucomicrobia bacterium]|nr:MAG: NAD(P)H-dependent oxidoreductase subunit E [Verrucomicrobiota bacterium]